MRSIELIAPKEEFQEQILQYKKEFEVNGDSMDGTNFLQGYSDLAEWFSLVRDNSKEETVREGLVPADTYLAIRVADQKLLGMINIRHRLNDYLFQVGGHIVYSVRKSERRKGYAKDMLRLSLERCRELNISKVLVTCDKENIASARTIMANNGVLENEVPEEDRITQRYWITL
ncbi:GNAT family N-acetyltransferase [Clostridium cellulovorans]|uniref:GCN5-related N-acetyltransferase n=1 Tax=Clostridium cellulovorans (strain ATCC 35296 / DSM 3052 / OCM 3 / 743B) TaxID=573061 RepID=D9SPL1_CLOC7|nr:GNAT family N-acetyltransferase [Clostridium cellulovorans]ADL50060.1 GCN5-related N-acetyltransferase [Clostridium cellulovorans 743B]